MQIYNKYEHIFKSACGKFLEERQRFEAELKKISYLRVIPSQANYFLCEVVDRFSSSELTEILLNRYNILIKDCNNKTGLNDKNYIRIAIRNSDDNNRLIEALKEI
jgi:histidinol-phosphate/aromatic aminotransferase/cobyric acid decarboxylase-like protein